MSYERPQKPVATAAQRKREIAMISRAVDDGICFTDAAATLGIPKTTLWRIMTANSLRFKTRKNARTREKRIVAAIAAGVETSAALAEMFGTTRAQMSVALCKIASRALIEYVPSKGGSHRRGRGFVRWRVKG